MRLFSLWWACKAAVLMLCFAACTTSAAPTDAPTQVLIPALPTATPIPIRPTETPAPILAPADVVVPTVTTVPESLEPIIQQIVADLAAALRIETDAVQVVRIQSTFWMTSSLGCDLENAPANERGAGYQIILWANNNFYDYHMDEAGTRFVRCEAVNPTAAATLAVGIVLELDPVAAELALLAQQRVAETLDLPVRRIHIVSVRAVRWTDSSLGCPQPDQSYAQAEIDGYRIVVSAGEREYAFHSDFDRLILCESEPLPEN